MSKKEQFEDLDKEQFDECKKVCELMRSLRRSKFIVCYNEYGDATEVIPGTRSKIIDKGEGSIPTELVCKLMEQGKAKIDIKTAETFIVHGSPVCCFALVTGGWICIC